MIDELEQNEDSAHAVPAAVDRPFPTAVSALGEAAQPSRRSRPSTWSVIRHAQGDGPQARAALGELISRYERTILHMVHAFGWQPSTCEREDLKQEFLTGMLARGDIRRLDRQRGESFRDWLQVAVKHFLLNQKKKGRAQKRDEGKTDRFEFQVLHGLTAGQEFDRSFAEATLQCALARLRVLTKDEARFDVWARVLPGAQLDMEDLEGFASALGMTRNAVGAEICRFRKRLKEELRKLVADTLDLAPDDPADPQRASAINRELGQLYRALREVPPLVVVREDA